MKNSLSKTELTGVIVLAVIIGLIIASSLLLKTCDGQQQEEPRVKLIDTVTAESDDLSGDIIEAEQTEGVKYSPGKRSTRTGGRRSHRHNSKVSSSESIKKERHTASRKSDDINWDTRDPFADTIPVDYDFEDTEESDHWAE